MDCSLFCFPDLVIVVILHAAFHSVAVWIFIKCHSRPS